ncbi:type II secretion system protein G [Parelusimicrobium proximum]|uniref:type IV pilin protein n=1 Tax=Parelusimicrobium proximum TaxID=3228953 RepID=UPI003D162DB4
MKKGFTLIELLVVVLIIAILAAVALPQYTKAVEKARATEALISLKALRDAQDRYYLANDAYATSLDSLDVEIKGTSFYTCSLGSNSGQVQCGRNGKSFKLETWAGGTFLRCVYYTDMKSKELCYSLFGNCSNDKGSWCDISI